MIFGVAICFKLQNDTVCEILPIILVLCFAHNCASIIGPFLLGRHIHMYVHMANGEQIMNSQL